MNVTGVNSSAQNTVPVKQNAADNYEKDIQQQIMKLQEKIKSLDSDAELSSEQKMNEKQKIQEQIQNLNKELRQHQLEKQQEEAEKKQAEARKAAENSDNVVQTSDISAGLSKIESGVMITLSETNKQMDHMRGVRNDLQAKLRTAETPEAKQKLQEKINRISNDMGKAIKKSTDTISDYRKSDKENKDKLQRNGNNDRQQDRSSILKNKDGSVYLINDDNKKVISAYGEQNKNNYKFNIQ